MPSNGSDAVLKISVLLEPSALESCWQNEHLALGLRLEIAADF